MPGKAIEDDAHQGDYTTAAIPEVKGTACGFLGGSYAVIPALMRLNTHLTAKGSRRLLRFHEAARTYIDLWE